MNYELSNHDRTMEIFGRQNHQRRLRNVLNAIDAVSSSGRDPAPSLAKVLECPSSVVLLQGTLLENGLIRGERMGALPVVVSQLHLQRLFPVVWGSELVVASHLVSLWMIRLG